MPEPQSLPEMLRIMDVATALRREREVAKAELDLDRTKQHLHARLQATAAATGEKVTDAEIEAAIDHYYRTLHRFAEPPPSWRTLLAHIWVRRTTIAAWGAALAVVVGLLYWLFLAAGGPLSPAAREARARAADARQEAAAQRQAEQQAEQRATRLAKLDAEVRRLHAAVVAVAREDAAAAEAATLLAEFEQVAAAGAVAADLTRIRDALQALRERLEEEFEVRVVSRPGRKSGVDAYYTDERGTRLSGYFLIVEAVAAGGRILKRTVRDSENGVTRTVAMWGELVPKAVYERIKADKQADGVVDDALFARKRRGYRELEMVMRGADGAPLVRGRQITENL